MLSADSRDERERFFHLLIEAGVEVLENHPEAARFLEGSGDILLSEIGLDSLAAMELAIAIEEDIGVSLTPDQILKHTSLKGLLLALAWV